MPGNLIRGADCATGDKPKQKMKCVNLETLKDCIESIGWEGMWLSEVDGRVRYKFLAPSPNFVDYWPSTGTVYTPVEKDRLALQAQIAVTDPVRTKPVVPKRKIVQISSTCDAEGVDTLFALCSDNTAWMLYPQSKTHTWILMPPIPQPEEGGES